MRPSKLLLLASVSAAAALAQTDDYRLALPDHSGLLKWSVSGFKIAENSAKSNGREIGVRGASTQIQFLLALSGENFAGCGEGQEQSPR